MTRDEARANRLPKNERSNAMTDANRIITPVYDDDLSEFAPYPGMTVHLELNPTDRTLYITAVPVGIGTWTFAHAHNRKFQFVLRNDLSGPSYAKLLKNPDVLALAERVADGYDIGFIDGNWKGMLTADANAALNELEIVIGERWGREAVRNGEPGDYETWSAVDWLTDEPRLATINATTTDDEIEGLAATLRAEAERERAYMPDLEAYLRSLVQEARGKHE